MAKSLVPKRKVVILRETATAFDAARAMCINDIGCVLVCNAEGALSGVLTDRDLTCAVLGRNLGPDTTLDKVMTRGVWTVDDAAGLDDETEIVQAQMLRESEVESEEEVRTFIERIEERSGFSRSATLLMLNIIMSSLFRSIHYTLAERFLRPLPEGLRARFEDLPAGPDQNISADFLIGEVVAQFNLDTEQAIEVIRQFWDGMHTCCGQAEMERFAEALPDDLRNLIAPPPLEHQLIEEAEPQNPLRMH